MVDITGYLIGFISAIIVALLVYTLNVRSTKKEKKEQKIAVHKLIKLEIDQNIKYLEKFLNEIKEESKKNETILGSIMGSLHLPPLNNGMYTKFALLLPNSFSEIEFEKLYDFYRSIDDIKFLYDKTVLIVTESKNVEMKFVGSSESRTLPYDFGPWLYKDELDELWNEFDEISSKVFENGNPL